MFLAILITAILVAALAVVGFFYMQISGKRREAARRAMPLEEVEGKGVCARCEQTRIIVNKEAGLCAFCWSSLRTKQT